jgi:hypothetical protein
MARKICGTEKKIADFLDDRGGIPASSAPSISSVSSRIFSMTSRVSFQSKPTVEALACNFTARVKPGRASGTPARMLSLEAGLALSLPFFHALPECFDLVRREATNTCG